MDWALISLLVWVAGMMGFCIPVTKFFYYDLCGEEKGEWNNGSFWLSIMMMVCTIWAWPILVLGWYIKKVTTT